MRSFRSKIIIPIFRFLPIISQSKLKSLHRAKKAYIDFVSRSSVEVSDDLVEFTLSKITGNENKLLGYRFLESDYVNLEPETVNYYRSVVKSDWIIYDCGANIGLFSILFSNLANKGEVHSFEPTNTFNLLQSNLAKCECKNVYLNNCALGSEVIRKYASIDKIFNKEKLNDFFDFTTIDQYTNFMSLKRLDLIKIDTDGFETEIIKGALESIKKFTPLIVLEWNENAGKYGNKIHGILAILSSIGYSQGKILDGENLVLEFSQIQKNFTLNF
jgi:FkbM family methyltransferase